MHARLMSPCCFTFSHSNNKMTNKQRKKRSGHTRFRTTSDVNGGGFRQIIFVACSGADSMGNGGTCPPHFYKWLGTGGTVSRRTANKKLIKLYWPSRKRSPKRLIVLLEPNSGGGDTKNFFPAFRAGPVPPTFKFVPAPLVA